MLEMNEGTTKFWRGCPDSSGSCSGGRGSASEREWESAVAFLRERLVVHHDRAASEKFGNPVKGVSLLPFHSSEAHQRRINVRAALVSQQGQNALPTPPCL